MNGLNSNNMEKEFVPYIEALQLKALGFNEPCFGYYNHIGNLFFNTNSQPVGKDWVWKGNELLPTDMVLAPTFSQAFRWFREKYGDYLLYSFGVIPHFTIIQNLIIDDSEITYEQAELACLKKLIEIVKNK